MGALLKYELKRRMRGMIGWSVGLIAFAGLYISVYPDVAEQMHDLADLSIYQVMGVELGSFEGYMSSVVLGFLPILLGVYALLMGTKALAGEEEAGTLELLMARSLTRSRIVLVKCTAIGITLLAVLVAASIGDGLILAGVKASMDTPTAVQAVELGRVVLSAWPICMAVAMIGMFLGAFMPNRRLASMLTGVVLAAGYFGENMTGMAASLEPLQPLFLFSYYDSTSKVFSDGVAAGDILVLLGMSLVCMLLTLFFFGRRDVTVGTWPWVRGKAPSAGH